MADQLLAIDIGSDILTGVVLARSGKSVTIAAAASVLRSDKPLPVQLRELRQKLPGRPAICRITLGAELFSYRLLEFPFSEPSMINKVISGEVLETLPGDAGALCLDYVVTARRKQGASVLAAVLEADRFAELLQLFGKASLDPDLVGISGVFTATQHQERSGAPESFLFLDAGLSRVTAVLLLQGQIALVRSLALDSSVLPHLAYNIETGVCTALQTEQCAEAFSALGRSVRQTFLAAQSGSDTLDFPVYLSGPVATCPLFAATLQRETDFSVRPAEPVASAQLKWGEGVQEKYFSSVMDRALALAVSSGKSPRIFNFRKDQFARKRSLGDIRRYTRTALYPLLFVITALALYGWYDYQNLKKQRDLLDQEIRGVFTKTITQATRIVDPVQQLQVAISDARKATIAGGGGSVPMKMLSLLAELSERIDQSLTVRLHKLTVDQNNFRLRGSADSFDTVYKIKQKLEESLYFSKVDMLSATQAAKTGKIDFELKVDFRL